MNCFRRVSDARCDYIILHCGLNTVLICNICTYVHSAPLNAVIQPARAVALHVPAAGRKPREAVRPNAPPTGVQGQGPYVRASAVRPAHGSAAADQVRPAVLRGREVSVQGPANRHRKDVGGGGFHSGGNALLFPGPLEVFEATTVSGYGSDARANKVGAQPAGRHPDDTFAGRSQS